MSVEFGVVDKVLVKALYPCLVGGQLMADKVKRRSLGQGHHWAAESRYEGGVDD